MKHTRLIGGMRMKQIPTLFNPIISNKSDMQEAKEKVEKKIEEKVNEISEEVNKKKKKGKK